MTSQNNQSIEVDPNYIEALNLLIQKFLSFNWCRENLAIPYGFERCESDTYTYALIAISNLSDLSKIGKDIKSAIAKAGFDCRFIEQNPAAILSIIEELDRGEIQEIGVITQQETRQVHGYMDGQQITD